MNIKLLIVGAAIGAVGVGAAQGHARRHHRLVAKDYAAPAQPVPYSQLSLRFRGDERPAIDKVSYADTGAAIDAAAADQDRNWAVTPPTTATVPH